MALPSPDCDVPLDVCCDMAFTIASNILEIAHTAVVGCIPITPCPLPEIVGYISFGLRVEDPVPDYLVVSLASLTPTPLSADRNQKMHLPIYRAEFQVRLLESGWPQPTGDDQEIIPPEPDEFAAAAKHAYAHGEAMYRALHVALTNNELNPYCQSGCFKAISALTPVEPTGGTVGWDVNITTDFDMSKSAL